MFSNLKRALPALTVTIAVFCPSSCGAVVLKTHADASITENGGVGTAVSAGNGTSTNSINVRWNPTNATPDRNEWGAYKFDFSGVADKTMVQNVTFNAFMHRGNTNNSGKNLHLYALTPGTEGEDWPEATVTYETMPGFTFDMDSSTNVLAVGTTLTDLGTFQLPASPALDTEGSLATVSPRLADVDVLTSLVQGLGTNNLLTVLITYQNSSNGTWNTITREATQSEATTDPPVVTGAAGDFAAFLEFSIGSTVLAGDFNDDDVVNAADYVVWRDNVGTETMLPNDTIGGMIDEDQYNLWKGNFGNPAGGGAITTGAAVPEPSCWILFAVAMIRLFGSRIYRF